MTYRAVLFDFFGTLTVAVSAPTETAPTARALGCDPAAFAALMRHTYVPRARGDYGAGPAALLRLALMLGQRPSSAQITAAARLRREAVRDVVSLRPDAVATLRRLQSAGLYTALVSDCTDEVPPIISELPIAPLLDATAYSCQVGACKPDQRLFLTASRRLGLEPSECVYLGDGGGRELSGASSLGMAAIQLAAADLADHLAHEPAPYWPGPSVTSLAELPRQLARQ